MFIEKKLPSVAPRALTANGNQFGLVQVADSRGLYVKQQISLSSNTQPPTLLEIKRFVSPQAFYVGPKGNIKDRIDISAYLAADGASIRAEEQDRPGITPAEIDRAVYMEEPIGAIRTMEVDERGLSYNADNPLPVVPVGAAADKNWDDLLLTRDPTTQDITVATYKSAGSTVRILTLSYDANSNLSEVKKS